MQGRRLAVLCAVLVAGCAGPAQLPSTPPTAAQAAVAQPAVAQELVTVNLVELAASQRDVVCRDRTRPGSRIVVGQECRLRSETGVTAEALRELDRELRRRGYTEDQVDVDGGLSAH
jgi:hypothetical protein